MKMGSGQFMDIAIFLAIGVLSAAIGFLLGHFVRPPKPAVDPNDYNHLHVKAAGAEQQCETLLKRVEELTAAQRNLGEVAKVAGEENARCLNGQQASLYS